MSLYSVHNFPWLICIAVRLDWRRGCTEAHHAVCTIAKSLAANALMSKTKTAITLYRALQKSARKIDAAFMGLEVRRPLDKSGWQTSAHEWSPPTSSEAL